MSRSQPIPDATDSEKQQIRDETTTVIISKRTSMTNGRLHLSNNGDPLCSERKTHNGHCGSSRQPVEYVEKDIAVFPPNYREWCSYCVEVWRDE